MLVSIGKDKNGNDKMAVRIATPMTSRFVDILEVNQESGKYEISTGLQPSAPEVAELKQLVQMAVNTRYPAWGGQIPAGGNDPTANMWDSAKYPEMQGLLKIKGTSGYTPVVIDQNNTPLDPSVWSTYLYQGCIVELVVTAWAFDNKSKGAAFSVEVIKVVDNTAPRIGGGGGMSSDTVAGIFGAPMGQAPVTPTANPAPVTPQASAPVATPPPVAAPVTPVKVYVHTDPAITKEQYQAHDAAWTEDLLVAQGKGRWEEQTPVAAPVAAPVVPAVPAVPGVPAGAPGVQPYPDFLDQPGVVPQ